MRTPALLLLTACTGPASPERPDFATAETAEARIGAVRFLPAAAIPERLDDLLHLARTDEDPRVRDQVALRLKTWGHPEAAPVLRAIYRDDPHWDVARAALDGLRTVCHAHHGAPRPTAPPEGPIPPECTPAYDGSHLLPRYRPPPRLDAAAFWRAEGVEPTVLSNGEVFVPDQRTRRAVEARYVQAARDHVHGLPRPPAPPDLKP